MTLAQPTLDRTGSRRLNRFFWPLLLGCLLLLAIIALPLSAPLFHWLFPELERPVYSRASFADLLLQHALLVAGASIVVTGLGLALGIAVTRPAGRDFAPLIDMLTAIGQTFPPAAVLALAVPIAGYGALPTLIALVVYGMLPVVDTTIAGLRSVPPDLREAADGSGFGSWGRLVHLELPLAAPIIMAGIRTSVVIAIGTATIGSTIGATTLGSPIIEGLSGSNPAYVVQGSIVVGLFAMVVDSLFDAFMAGLHR